MALRYNDYLQKVRQRLISEKYEIVTDLKIGGFTGELFAWKLVFSILLNYRAVCFLRYSERADAEEISNYSRAVYEYARDYKPILDTALLVFPVIASQRFADKAKSFVGDLKGRSSSWGNFQIEHPVLVELETGTVYQFEKTPFIGGGAVHVAKDFVVKHLSP